VGRAVRVKVIEQLAKEANFTVSDLVQDEIDIFFLGRLGNLLCLYMTVLPPSTDFPLPRLHNPNYLTPPDKPTISYSTLKQLSGHLRQFLRMIIQTAIKIAEADCELRAHRILVNNITENHIRKSLSIFTGKESPLSRINFIRTLPARLNLTLVNKEGTHVPDSYAQHFFNRGLPESPLESKDVFNRCVEIAGPSISIPIAYRRPNWAFGFEGREYEDEEDEYLRSSSRGNDNYDNTVLPLLSREPDPEEDEELTRELMEEEEQDVEDTTKHLLYEHQLWEMYDAKDWRFRTHVDDSSFGEDRSGNERGKTDLGRG